MTKKKQYVSLKEKKTYEFLGAAACEPEHDS